MKVYIGPDLACYYCDDQVGRMTHKLLRWTARSELAHWLFEISWSVILCKWRVWRTLIPFPITLYNRSNVHRSHKLEAKAARVYITFSIMVDQILMLFRQADSIESRESSQIWERFTHNSAFTSHGNMYRGRVRWLGRRGEWYECLQSMSSLNESNIDDATRIWKAGSGTKQRVRCEE